MGIIRTEKKIIEELKKLSSAEVRLFIYSNEGFSEADFSRLIRAQNYSSTETQKVKNDDENNLFPIIGKKQALKNLAQSFISLSPRPVRPFVNLLSKGFAVSFKKILILKRKVRDFSLRTEKNVISENKRGMPQYSSLKDEAKPNPFKNGDIVITVGTVWDYPSMLDDLFILKERKNLKVVSYCHDIIPLEYPQYCLDSTVATFGSYILGLVRISNVICCNSKCTQIDLENYLVNNGVKKPPTKLLYLGCDITPKIDGDYSPYNRKGKFILYVSTLERRKNHELLYKSYRSLLEKGYRDEIPDLYFVGGKGWGVSEVLRDIDCDPILKGKIKILGRLQDDELETLYKAAYFIVFPSFYEGWGLAISEAFSYGKFVISSDRGSLPEAGAGLSECLDPYDVKLWADRILFYSQNPDVIKYKEHLIKTRWQPHTWAQSAQTLADIIATVDAN